MSSVNIDEIKLKLLKLQAKGRTDTPTYRRLLRELEREIRRARLHERRERTDA